MADTPGVAFLQCLYQVRELSAALSRHGSYTTLHNVNSSLTRGGDAGGQGGWAAPWCC